MKNTILLLTLTLIINSCGGGSGGTTPTPNDTIPQENNETTPSETTDNNQTSLDNTQENQSNNSAQESNETTPGDTNDSNEAPPPIINDNQTSTDNSTQNDTPLLPSDEPYYKYSWHIDSIVANQYDEYSAVDKEADIGVTKAWETTHGEGVKVAMIDNGFDVNHEDLKENIAVVYSVDNDNNEVGNTSQNKTLALHGNSCAGFIVAPINGKGSIGIAPSAKLIGIKLLSQEDSDTIKAFEYAQIQGAKVISCSWGTNDVSEAIVAKLKELYEAGITVLFASGNEGESLDVAGVNDESEVEWVIGVGASGENNDVTTYSNYGKNIEIIAPGGDTEKLGLLGIDDSGEQGSTNQQGLVDNNYAFMDGTSFAAPIAAGVVALMYGANPDITPSQVRSILIATATKIGGEDAHYVDGLDEKRAYGKINAYMAVTQAQSIK